jgi:signal recognition particle receptor subunit alpha
MLDLFSIFSKGGILLWCFKGAGLLPKEWEAFTPTINELIKSVLLQERAVKKNYWESGQLALRYKMDNEFELVFVIAYQKMLNLHYLDKLLDEIQLRFRDMFQDNLQSGKFLEDFSGFGPEFTRTLRLVEEESRIEKLAQQKPRKFEESEKSQKSIKSMIVSDKNEAKPKKDSKKSVKIAEESIPETVTVAKPVNDLDEQTRLENLRKLSQKKKSPKSPNPKSPKSGKKSTTWDPVVYGGKLSKEEMNNLDRTVGKPQESEDVDIHFNQYVPDPNLVGSSAQLEDVYYEDDEEEMLKSNASGNSGGGGMFSMFSNLVGNKALTREDLEPVLAKLRDTLIAKNVANEVAGSLIESVMVKLEGSVMGTFQSIARTVKDSLTQSLMKLLTPKRRIDILRDVLEAKENKKPYVITFCGVNGVGKSTNLAKICFWLIENKFSVLIAACDTFRAGAVEQLRTHTRRLNSLHPPQSNKGVQMVQLYEKGYGKDAAGIALEAINHARDSGIDVVLVDTAGRMQDNEPLMRALSKLISVNAPDLVLFVGEALVGNEAIDQLVKFNAALADHSASDNPHTIDGIVLTKFDTIDDKVGSAISMTYISGQPIVFVGTGQTYTDLKSLNSKAVVTALMK